MEMGGGYSFDLFAYIYIYIYVDGRIILGWIFRKWDVGYVLEGDGSGYRQMAGTCECGNELSGSIKCVEFLD
jgi:hypothetical protein